MTKVLHNLIFGKDESIIISKKIMSVVRVLPPAHQHLLMKRKIDVFASMAGFDSRGDKAENRRAAEALMTCRTTSTSTPSAK
mmetsp:Transcript_18107/g.31623  ORF Transcript_18107/g.31623 Transcript_18107/m.31623 type:complete len:82 (+) Transcript_18107:361-606(+)